MFGIFTCCVFPLLGNPQTFFSETPKLRLVLVRAIDKLDVFFGWKVRFCEFDSKLLQINIC